MLDTLKPGQAIKCTVKTLPRAAASRKTIERLMRQNPEVKKGLRRAYQKRVANWQTKNRGNRDWVMRVKSGKIVRCARGASWTMAFDLNLLPDLQSVEKNLTIAKA